MYSAYDKNKKTQLFLNHSAGCKSVIELFDKVKTLTDTTLQGDIVEGLVKVMMDCKKRFGFESVAYADGMQEGYDLIAKSYQHGTIPIQVKFRSSELLSNDELNSFGKVNWLQEFKSGYVVGNLRDVPPAWHNDKVSLFLKEDFREIDLQELVEFASIEVTTKRGPMIPRGYQDKWLTQLKKNIGTAPRGKILGPPGIGKTLAISTYIRYLKKNKLGFVGAPWIRLVNQNMAGIVEELFHHGYDVRYLVVNSSASVKTPTLAGLNDGTHSLNEYNIVKPTTNVKEIKKFLNQAKKDKTKNRLYIVFVCYGSTDAVLEASRGFKFDFAAFDEAHNLTGHESKSHLKLLDDSKFRSNRRAFVTATEKVYNGENDEVIAMNDENVFGNVMCNCTFKDAIEHGNIKDYRVVMPELSKDATDYWWNALQQNLYVFDDGEPVTMAQVALKVLVYKMYKEYPITRMIAGFNGIDNAKNMSIFFAVEDAITKHFGFVLKSTWVSSKETQATNNKRISEFADSSEKYVMCAPPMLKEGIDIKGVDKDGKYQYPNAVVFCENKRGEIPIVQLAGRGLRKSYKDELCYIGLPMIYGKEETYNECFERAREVITSLACNDERVAQEIMGMRVGKSQVKQYKQSTKIIEIPEILATSIDFEEFVQSMRLSIVQSIPKASYEEHVAYINKNKLKNGIDYTKTKKDSCFYAKFTGLQKAFPDKDVFNDVGWRNHYAEKASYEEHVKFCKNFRDGEDYNRAKKERKYYSSYKRIKSRWGKDIHVDAGWFNHRCEKATFDEHIKYIKLKKYKNALAYRKDKEKDGRFFASDLQIINRWGKDRVYSAAGWHVKATKASYEEHVSEGKKYKFAAEYTRAKKDKMFFTHADSVKNNWHNKNFAKDCGWI